MGEPRLWRDLTSPQLEDAQKDGAVVLQSIGAIEQHGPHLPVDTDISGAYESALEVSRRRPYALVAPPLWWGVSGMHRDFPGLLSLRPETLTTLLYDLCDSMVDQGLEKIVLVVGHASNKPVVQSFVHQFMLKRGIRLLQLNYVNLSAEVFADVRKSGVGGEAHAGELETALQMHIRPGEIDPSDAPIRYIEPRRDFGLSSSTKDIFKGGDSNVGWDLKSSFPEGVIGDPTVATEETGSAVFEAIVDKLCSIIDEYKEL